MSLCVLYGVPKSLTITDIMQIICATSYFYFLTKCRRSYTFAILAYTIDFGFSELSAKYKLSTFYTPCISLHVTTHCFFQF